MTGTRVVLGAGMLLALVSTAEAQGALLVPGARVRVTGPCLAELPSGPAQCTVVTGRLISWTAEGIMVQEGAGAASAVARGDTKLIEVSGGVQSHRTLGALVGGGAGLAVGLAVSCHPEPKTESQSLDYVGCTFFRLLLAPALVGVGMGVGAIVGQFIRSEKWSSLVRRDLAFGIVPAGHAAVGLTINLRF